MTRAPVDPLRAYAGGVIVHRSRPFPAWWLVFVGVVVAPLFVGRGVAGWLLYGGGWLAIAVVLAWRHGAGRRQHLPRCAV